MCYLFNQKLSNSLTLLFVLVVISNFVKPAFAEDWLYTVRKGETLWGLCEKYTVVKDCWLKIGSYNGVTYPRIMPPGTRIKFPVTWLKVAPIPVTITFVRGQVDVLTASGEIEPAKVGRQVFIGDSVVALKGSATLLFADGSISILGNDSTVKMDLLSVDDTSAIVDSRIVLERGTVSTKVPKYQPAEHDALPDQSEAAQTVKKLPQRRSRFQVTTPSAVAAVRGTDFSISASELGDEMRGAVYSGLISVHKNDVSPSVNSANLNNDNAMVERNLPVGFGILVKKNEPLPQPVALLSAPILHDKSELQALPLVISWENMVAAKSYSIRVLSGEDKSQLIFNTQLAETEWTSTDLIEGCYTVLINAIDENDLLGHAAKLDVCVANKPKAVELVYDPELKEIRWLSVEGAQSYRVEFSKKQDFKVIDNFKVVDSVDGLTYMFSLVDAKILSSGYVRVIPMHVSGLEGNESIVVEIEARNRNWITGVISFLILLTAL